MGLLIIDCSLHSTKLIKYLVVCLVYLSNIKCQKNQGVAQIFFLVVNEIMVVFQISGSWGSVWIVGILHRS
jgi:hypothetical protein